MVVANRVNDYLALLVTLLIKRFRHLTQTLLHARVLKYTDDICS